jgi:flavin-dependent dehydrogenase
LTLALQLKAARPEIRVVVVEKRPGAAPDAAFKVGESTVEIGGHYYGKVIGLHDYLVRVHLIKRGLRFFWPFGDNSDIARRVELSPPDHIPVTTYQLDRGRLENDLVERVRAAGIDLQMGAFIDSITLGDDVHIVSVVRGGPGGERSEIRGRWLVDASGRASLLKTKLDLAQQNGHDVNSSWLRLAGGLDLEDFSNDPRWLGRMPERGLRPASTNHLMGTGYWLWLIQLGTGPISIGLCADPRFHPFEQINTLDGLLEWMREHEPQVGAAIEKRRDDVLDFLKLENFSYSCKQFFSGDRWCLVGEAGAFNDPLYSPGSDFIAIGNTMTTDLILRDLAGEPISPTSPIRRLRSKAFFFVSGKAAAGKGKRQPPIDIAKAARRAAGDDRVAFYNFMYRRALKANLSLYENQYELFGNAQAMLIRQVWGLFSYWGILAKIFVDGKFGDADFLASVTPVFDRWGRLSTAMQDLFREWNKREQREFGDVVARVAEFPTLYQLHCDLENPLDDDALRAKLAENVKLLNALAVVIFHEAAGSLPEKPDKHRRLNPARASLEPGRWEKDGLFADDGVSLVEARELLPGIDEFLLSQRSPEREATSPSSG